LPVSAASGDAPPQGGVEASLVDLLTALRAEGYQFVTPTPSTHRRVVARPENAQANDLRGAFGWSLPFAPGLLAPELIGLMQQAGVLVRRDGLLASTVRVSSLGPDLFLHSAYPPAAADAVFFGPDTYRFAAFLEIALADYRGGRVLADIGAGSGAGAITAARLARPDQVVMSDTNPKALMFARANAAAAKVTAQFRLASGLEALDEPADLIIANPPFIAGEGGRAYRDGGDLHGARLSLDWALAGAERLGPGGMLAMYTGSAIVAGQDGFRAALTDGLDASRFTLAYRELDPDIFGGELNRAANRDVDRIAAVGLVIRATH
jgi:hypothetical protein